VRGRTGWKYALGLDLAGAGFGFSALPGFRSRVPEHGVGHQFLDVILARCAQPGLLRAGGRMRTDSTHVAACVRDLNRVEFVTGTLRCALEALSVAAPDWLAGCGLVTPAWLERYGQRAGSCRLPEGDGPRARFAAQAGSGGYALLEAIDRDGTPRRVSRLPAIGVLRTVRGQHFGRRPGGGARYREAKELPAGARRLVSPHDPDARCAVRRTTARDGYKARFTGTCDPGAPRLAVSGAATPAAAGDSTVTALVHRGLHARSLAPAGHFAGTGYASAALLVQSASDGAGLAGPARATGGRGSAGPRSYKSTDFKTGWNARQATCPQGRTSSRRTGTADRGEPRVRTGFYRAGCPSCPARAQCATARFRVLTVQPREQYEALQARRAEQETDAWKARYATRAGAEGTALQGRRHGNMNRQRGSPAKRSWQTSASYRSLVAPRRSPVRS
jgi:hypothetical protein